MLFLETQSTEYHFINDKNSVSKLNKKHLQVMKEFSGSLQEEIFKIVTVFISSMSVEARQEMENKYLKK